MRNSILASLALAGVALLFSAGAMATPIHVGLIKAAGNHEWTSPKFGDPSTLTLTAWQYDGTGWTSAVMDATLDNTGLGVACDELSSGSACGEGQIGSVPWQVIDMDITDLTDWTGLTINLLSVDPQFSGFLLGASCNVTGTCTPTPLAVCYNQGSSSKSCTLNLSRLSLLGITDIWITPSAVNPDGVNEGNIVLGADFVLDGIAVPEPSELGTFGLGLLLIGLLAVLRRRRAH